MIFKASIVLISFLLESILSNYVSINTMLFNPLFSIISLIIIYPYFKNDNMSFIKSCLIFGVIYDLIFTLTFPLHVLLFGLTGILIILINNFISNHLFNLPLISLAIIINYRIISYLILVLIGYLDFHFNILLNGITSSILVNIIYVLVLYLITDYYAKKHHIVKID